MADLFTDVSEKVRDNAKKLHQDAKDPALMSQTQQILFTLEKFGYITPLDALRDFGIMRLASRIFDLRKRGHIITMEEVTEKNRFGKNVTFAKYRLQKQKADSAVAVSTP